MIKQEKIKQVWILVQSLDNKTRVRLRSGKLTPAFEYHTQAFRYAEAKGIEHCDIIKV